MADTDNGFIVTRAGLNAVAKAIAGKQLVFSRVAFGDSEVDGVVIPVTDAEAFEQTAMINWRKDLPMVGQPTVSGGVANIKFLVQNADVEEGFYMRETGVFALDPDTGEEILYAYENVGLRGGFLPPVYSNTIWQQENVVAIAVGGAERITAIVDESLLYVTQAEFQEHIGANKPHPNTPTVEQAVTETDYVLTYGSDKNFHPMTLANFTRQALGGDASEIPQLRSRVSQTEVNIANLYMQLDAEHDLGVVPNLLLTDDFDNPDKTDYYREKVITSAAGINNVRVASLAGIHAGSWYTISDGTQSEFVQTTAVAKNGEANVVVFADEIVNTYDLTNTYLYRTTTTAENGTGVGAGDIRSEVYPFTEIWQGTSADSTSTLTLNTTLANSAAFTLSGSWAFNSNGEFTLI